MIAITVAVNTKLTSVEELCSWFSEHKRQDRLLEIFRFCFDFDFASITLLQIVH